MGKKAAEPEISQLELAQKSARERLRFTQAQLNEYLERFPESHRETVYDYFVTHVYSARCSILPRVRLY